MAESMEEDGCEGSIPLTEDLTCPVCRCIYRDPVVLLCTHTLCRECLQGCAKANSKCPVCRQVFKEDEAVPVRALGRVCETFQETRWRPPQRWSDVDLCNVHHKELELYCEKDEEPLCVECVTLHSTHRLLQLRDGAAQCKKQLNYKVQILEKKVSSYKKMTHKLGNTVEHIKSQAGQAEMQIRVEFEMLRQALVTDEALRLKALADEEEQKIAAAQDWITTINKEVSDLAKLIDSLKREMGNEDLPLVRNYQDLKRRAQWTNEDPALPDDSLLSMGKHVGSLSFNIWKKLQAHVKYHPVVLDPNTASPWLSLNADLTGVKESTEPQNVPDNPERFDPCVFILGAEGFTSGKHKWDVFVGQNPKWIVGVCKESVVRKKKFTVSASRGVWSIGLTKGVYTALTQERTNLEVKQRPERIRVKLNIEKGEVSFWDGGTSQHLVTLTHKFDEKLYPIFGPGLHDAPITLLPGKIAVHTS
ncbi:tripartite motif containing 35-28 [Genypterus blacodes]|uniref:tripartite motif containing 35-28 n=1 Tax=Genypterus blacodes TaxID=154954 RepID=UPI003F75741F